MTAAALPPESVATDELAALLEDGFAKRGQHSYRIARLERRPFAYQSSFPLEELIVTLTDGTHLSLLFKTLTWDALPTSVQCAKPRFLYDPLREIEVYRQILDADHLGTPVCYGVICDENSGRYGVVLETVSGDQLHEIGELAIWEEAARWLGRLHAYGAGQAGATDGTATHLLCHDGPYYRRWMQRARDFVALRSAAERSRLESLATRHERVVEWLLALPRSFIHGEYYAANVLIRQGSGRVCPVDWEMGAIGPSLMDLAALVAGSWNDSERMAMILAYHAACVASGKGSLPLSEMLVSLDVCRLQLAVQWLGWAPDWLPPPPQRHDWLSDALNLADKLKP